MRSRRRGDALDRSARRVWHLPYRTAWSSPASATGEWFTLLTTTSTVSGALVACPSSTRSSKGQGHPVMGRCAGGFAEHALMDAREAMRVPERLAWGEAAAPPLVFLVVYDMLVAQGRLATGDWLLVTGVSSGVGVAGLQTGKVLGTRVIGTSGSNAKLARLAGLGSTWASGREAATSTTP